MAKKIPQQLKEIWKLLQRAQGICPHDEFDFRQRELLWAIAEYITLPFVEESSKTKKTLE